VKRTESRFWSAGRRLLEMVVSAAVLIAVWEGLIRAFEVPPYLFPTPSSVAVSLWHGLIGGQYLRAMGITLTEILTGFAGGSLLGLGLGVALVSLPVLDRLVYPYIVAIQTIPKVAIAPLMIVWFGFGIQSKILIVALTCMFPVLVNTIAGMRATDSDRIALVRSLCGSRMQLLRYVQFPSALPYIFAGLNTGIVLSVIGAIVGEFVGARAGIGVLILQANFSLDLAAVFALLIMLGVAGVLLSILLRFLERHIVFWSGKTTK
jgi:NitT/TauT family transport system permease protein